MIVDTIFEETISPSVLYLVKLPDTKSKIIQNNNYKVYCAKYPNYKGLFRKDINETKEFGKMFCDNVAQKMNNLGFFTSDERPKYGISYGITEKEYDYILEQISADEDHHLVVMFAYPEREALETKTYFENMLRIKYLDYQLNKNSETLINLN
jgi:Glu-tRNA(Gln) amidotransferase subunit E-like FAD-binding protein